MAAIGDVARLAGVSKATASRALSGRGYVADDTRRRVEAAAAEIGYIASPDAASLVTGRTKNVGVIIPFVNRWFFGEVLEGIERALLGAGYDLTLYNLSEPGPGRARVFDFFLARKRVDAVIAVGVDLDEHEVASLDRREKPLVCLGGSGGAAARLSVDDRAVGQLATEHLLHLGHTRIAHLAGAGAAARPASVQGQRRQGFLDAVAAAGIPAGEHAHILEAEMSMPGGHTGALQLLGHPGRRPTALFAASDEMAFGTIRAAERLGIDVPARPVGHRRRRPRVRRDVRAHDRRAVPRRAGAARGRRRAAAARRGDGRPAARLGGADAHPAGGALHDERATLNRKTNHSKATTNTTTTKKKAGRRDLGAVEGAVRLVGPAVDVGRGLLGDVARTGRECEADRGGRHHGGHPTAMPC